MAHSAQGHRRGGPQGFCVHTITGPTEQRSEPSRVELSCRDSPTSGLAQRRGHRAPERKGLLVDSVRGSWAQDASSSPRSVLPRGHRAGLASSCLDVRTQYLLRSSRPCHLLRQVPGAPVSQQQGRHLHTLDPSMLVETRSQCALYPWWPAENS